MLRKILPTFALSVMLLSSTAASAGMATLATPAAGQPLAPDSALAFTLSSTIPKEQLDNLFVEFDGYDVTNMVGMNGLTVTFQPPQRLSPGDYRLRLLEKTATGKFNEIENWTVRVGAAGLEDSSITGTLDAQYAYLAADNLHGDAAEPPHQFTANLDTLAKTGGPGWDASLKLNGLVDSVSRRNVDRDSALLGEYLATGRTFSDSVNTAWNLGNHNTGVSNLLMDNFYRRGVSGQLSFMNEATVTAFAQDPSRTIGQENAGGFNDEDQRAAGVFGKIYPFDEDQRISLETGYYTATGALRSFNTSVPDDTQNSGNGWVVAAEGQTPDDKINLRGDYARTQFDDDGKGALVSAKSDNAERIRLTFAPLGNLRTFDANQSQWTVTALQQRTGTYFRSLVNTTLPQDENRMDLSSNYQNGSFTLFGQAYYTKNNVDNEPELPTDGTFGLNGQTSFSLLDAYGEGVTAKDWLNYSTFTAGGSYISQDRTHTPGSFAGIDLDQSTWTANAGWTATIDNATLSVQNVYSDFRDRVTHANSYTDDLTTLSGTYPVNDKISVTPQLQYEALDSKGAGSSSKYFAGIDTTAIIIPDILTHTLHYSALIDSSVDGQDQRNASSTLTWQIKPPAKNDPGVALAVSGYYQDLRGVIPTVVPTGTTAPTNGEDFKVYLQLKISTPFGF